jgi:hypothetical protein
MHRLIWSLSSALIVFAVGNAAIAQQGSGQRPDQTEPLLAQASPAPGSPGVNRGWSCSSCPFGATYCVINLMRYEHVCAPFKSYACAGFSGTSYCAFGSICWDGTCTNLRW